MPEQQTLRIAIYSGDDTYDFARILEKHLIGLWPPEGVRIWHRGCIRPGEVIRNSIARHLNEADFVLLLVSPELVHYWNKQLSASYERSELARHRIIPVLRTICSWQHLPISSLPYVPFDGQPAMAGAPDEARVHLVCTQVRELIDRAQAAQASDARPAGAHDSSARSHGTSSATESPSFLDLLAYGGDSVALNSMQSGHWARALTAADRSVTVTEAASLDELVLRLQSLLGLPPNTVDPRSVAGSFMEAATRLHQFARGR